jgi:hypothetical protein
MNEIEIELRTTVKEVFVESIFWDLYEKTCIFLEFANRQKELKLYKGTLGEKKNKSMLLNYASLCITLYFPKTLLFF